MNDLVAFRNDLSQRAAAGAFGEARMVEFVSTIDSEHLLINFYFIMSGLYYIKTTEMDVTFFKNLLAKNETRNPHQTSH